MQGRGGGRSGSTQAGQAHHPGESPRPAGVASSCTLGKYTSRRAGWAAEHRHISDADGVRQLDS